MRKVMKLVLILLGVILILLIAGFFYIKSKLPNGGGNNDITEGYYIFSVLNFPSKGNSLTLDF